MSELNNLLGQEGAGVPMVIDGQTYTLCPLTLKDKGEFEYWLEQRAIAGVKRLFGNDPDELREQRQHVNDNVAAGTYAFGGEVFQKALRQQDGLMELFRLMLRKHHGLTSEQVTELIGKDPNEAVRAMQTLAPQKKTQNHPAMNP